MEAVHPSPIPSHPRLEEIEKPRKVLTPRVRGEPTCSHETQSPVFSLLPSWFCLCLGQLNNRMLLLTWRLLGEPLLGCSPGQRLLSPAAVDEVTAGAPQASAFPVEILAPLGTWMYSSLSR